jgi:HD-GYP domain-containing protein (c-di-GMP phosphodiesterase class II)
VAALSLPKGCLTPDERRQIEEHVVDSYSFLVLIPWTRDLSGVPAIAHGHHEKLDGSGYPMGLRGPQISVQTRILTICDIWDALTAGDRPYKKAVPVEQALDLMQEECQMPGISTAACSRCSSNPGRGSRMKRAFIALMASCSAPAPTSA